MVEHTTVALSVIPYPCRMAHPGNMDCKSSAVSSPKGAAPVKMLLTEERSYCFTTSLDLVIVMMIGGTKYRLLILYVWMVSRKLLNSNLGRMMTPSPRYAPKCATTIRA